MHAGLGRAGQGKPSSVQVRPGLGGCRRWLDGPLGEADQQGEGASTLPYIWLTHFIFGCKVG